MDLFLHILSKVLSNTINLSCRKLYQYQYLNILASPGNHLSKELGVVRVSSGMIRLTTSR